MSETTEMMLDGTLCQVCGVFMGQPTGFPITCYDCQPRDRKPPAIAKATCPTCGKRVKAIGLADHQRDVHAAVHVEGNVS